MVVLYRFDCNIGISIKVVTFQTNKKKNWFSDKTRLVFVYDEVCKGTSRKSIIFKMELFTTIWNLSKSYKELHLMCLQPIAFWNLRNIWLGKHLQMLYSTTKKLFPQNLNITWLSASINKFPAHIYYFKFNIRNSRTRSKICSKLKRNTPEQHQLAEGSRQLTLLWCLSLLIFDKFHTVF